MKILVLTDRFPPYSEGGAEISLSLVISKLIEDGFIFTVITFAEDIDSVEKRFYRDIPVYRIPYSSSWPVTFWEKRKVINFRPAFLAVRIHRLSAYFAYFAKSLKKKDFLLRIKKGRLYRFLTRKGLLRYFPMVDEDISDVNSTKRHIKKIFLEFQPDLVHADNFRSILLSKGLFPGVPLVNQIRDNRFYCVNNAQPMNINGVVCRSCELGCVDRAPKEHLDDIKALMKRDLLFRQEALINGEHVIVTSRFLESQVCQFIPEKKVSIVVNPADEADRYIEQAVRVTFPHEILIVGMINDNKGQLRILEWFDMLDNALEDYRIVIAGRGDRITSMLKNRLNKKGVSDKVIFTGYLSRDELYRTYSRATIVACPNTWPEPFGRVPLEAGLSRKAVVAFGVGGLAENIIDGKTGVLVPENDNIAFVMALVDLILNPQKAQMLGDNAYQFIRENYKVEQSAYQLKKVWSDSCASFSKG